LRDFSGLLVFLALFSYPIWHGVRAKTSTGEPELKMPAGEKKCVAPREYMRAAHMDLLMRWRDGAVREQGRRYVSEDLSAFWPAPHVIILLYEGRRP